MNIVMNNNNLRSIIFSFFRDKTYKICNKCKETCMLNDKKIIKKFVHFKFDDTNICYPCFRKSFFNSS